MSVARPVSANHGVIPSNRERWLLGFTVLACAGLTIAVHYPGQMSVDTVIQLYEGRARVYLSNQPAPMSLLLAVLGPGATLILNVSIYAAAVIVLLERFSATVRHRWIAAAALFLFPVVLTYNGILWKDVLFANLAVLGFLVLPFTSGSRERPTLILSGALLGIGCVVRQQAVVAALFAAAATLPTVPGSAGRTSRFGRLVYWAGGWIGAVLLFNAVVIATAVRYESVAATGPLYQVVLYDLAGIIAHVPDARLPALERAGVDRAALSQRFSRYGADRVDSLAPIVGDPVDPLGGVPNQTLRSAWLSAIRDYPTAYLQHRLDVLAWLLGLHDVTRCLPYHVGVSAEPAAMARELRLGHETTKVAMILSDVQWSRLFLYRPFAYALVAIGLVGYLLWRGPRDAPILLLQVAGLAYVAAYLVIGIACDFRYAYFMVLASIIGVVYVVLTLFADRARRQRIA